MYQNMWYMLHWHPVYSAEDRHSRKRKTEKENPAPIQLDYMKKLSSQINARHEFYSVTIGALLA